MTSRLLEATRPWLPHQGTWRRQARIQTLSSTRRGAEATPRLPVGKHVERRRLFLVERAVGFEATAGTLGIVVIVLIVSTVLGVIDFGLSRLMQLVLQ